MEEYLRSSGYGIASQINELRLARADNAEVRRDANADHLAALTPKHRQQWVAELGERRRTRHSIPTPRSSTAWTPPTPRWRSAWPTTPGPVNSSAAGPPASTSGDTHGLPERDQRRRLEVRNCVGEELDALYGAGRCRHGQYRATEASKTLPTQGKKQSRRHERHHVAAQVPHHGGETAPVPDRSDVIRDPPARDQVLELGPAPTDEGYRESGERQHYRPVDEQHSVEDDAGEPLPERTGRTAPPEGLAGTEDASGSEEPAGTEDGADRLVEVAQVFVEGALQAASGWRCPGEQRPAIRQRGPGPQPPRRRRGPPVVPSRAQPSRFGSSPEGLRRRAPSRSAPVRTGPPPTTGTAAPEV